ncbi:hypothetical protein N7G274_002336 [Stereocaulon virgatum]|uniref:Uncharacterized protein n=1 Tax=Stereocaulon virgatum TaxID=373712 RepID=A0ABR4AHJ5_9LECA
MTVTPIKVCGFVPINMDASSTFSVNVNGSVTTNGATSGINATKVHNFISGSMSSSDTDPVECDDSPTTTRHIAKAVTQDPRSTDAVDQPEGLVDPLCKALHSGKPCATNSGNHRKVISHVFGRNKTSTQQLPEDCWILWCRMHYQRNRYRDISLGVWHKRQLEIVRDQLNAFENFNADQKWKIALRKATQDTLIAESLTQASPAMSDADMGCDGTPACWERFLAPYTGSHKTFGDIRNVLAVIEKEFNTPAFLSRDNKDKVFPGVEFLAMSTADEDKKAIVKRKTYTRVESDTMTTSPLRKHDSTPNLAAQATELPNDQIRKRKSAADVGAIKPRKRRHLVRGADLYRLRGLMDREE